MRLRHILLILMLCLSGRGNGQSTENALKARLIGRPLYLRGSWRENTLKFDGSGHLVGTSGLLPFTLCGVEVKKIHIQNDRLILDAKRVGVELNKPLPKRVVLQVGEINSTHDETLNIEISRPSDGDYGTPLNAIFADGLADLTPSLPEYWQAYARKNFLLSSAPASTTQSTPPTSQAKKVGGAIKPPVLLKSVDPQFNDAARKLKYQAKIVIGLIAEKNGSASHLCLIKPAGLGLDEEALYAVQNYVFKPATENGSPVRVQLGVEVNFQIY